MAQATSRVVFPADSVEEVAPPVEQDCADNIPLQESADKYDLERVRIAAFKVSEGSLDRLGDAID